MNEVGAKLLNPRAAHRMALVLGVVLAGCATAPGKPTALGSIPPAWPAVDSRHPRILLASSDGPATSGEPTGQAVQGYNVPGRNPNSQAPWELFLGNAAHRLIAYMYGVNYPTNRVFYNKETIFRILSDIGRGDPSRLLADERFLRPDITDATTWSVFEIKPRNERGLQEGRQKVQIQLAALNRAVAPDMTFTGGTDFHGEVLIRFAQGQYIWRLEWQTTEPGITQYRWTRSQQRFESAAEASDAGQWVTLTEQEMRQYGGWVGQAVDGMVDRREQLATVSGVVGIVIDIIGEGAKGIISGAILGRMGSGSEAQQPPVSGGWTGHPLPSTVITLRTVGASAQGRGHVTRNGPAIPNQGMSELASTPASWGLPAG